MPCFGTDNDATFQGVGFSPSLEYFFFFAASWKMK
jgi:hypothetical protein